MEIADAAGGAKQPVLTSVRQNLTAAAGKTGGGLLLGIGGHGVLSEL
jgi:hypothetical protein